MRDFHVTEQHVREAREQGDLKELLAMARQQGATEAARNKSLVLAHDDLASRLTAPPCSFARPEMWTGYIGPAHIEGRFGEQVLNESPYRAQLVALVEEAERRARTENAA